MAANSSSVPRWILRNNGMSPMPSGSRRMTSSVTPGRRVGLIMPTTPRLAPSDAARREAALVVAANDGRVFQKLVLAQQTRAAAPLAGTARIGDEFEAGNAAGKLGFENFDRGDVQVAQMRCRGGGTVVSHAAAIGRTHDLVLHAGLAGTALGPGDGQRAR